MNYTLYKQHGSNPKWNAQRNLEGRTSYVSDDTLRFHHACIRATYITDGGLLFSLVESVALDMHNTKRGFRYVVFDLFGTVVSRVDLEDSFKTSGKAKAAMWDFLNNFDAEKHTKEAIKRHKEYVNRQLNYLKDDIKRLKADNLI